MTKKEYDFENCEQNELTEQEKELLAWDMVQGLCREITHVERN